MAVWTTGPALGDLEAGGVALGDLGELLDRQRWAGVRGAGRGHRGGTSPAFANYDAREHMQQARKRRTPA